MGTILGTDFFGTHHTVDDIGRQLEISVSDLTIVNPASVAAKMTLISPRGNSATYDATYNHSNCSIILTILSGMISEIGTYRYQAHIVYDDKEKYTDVYSFKVNRRLDS